MLNLKQWFCNHNHVIYCDGKHYECLECGAITDIPTPLCEASGVFERIADRIEQEKELARLTKLAEEYLADTEYNKEVSGS